MFDKTLNEIELAARKSFKQVCSNFLGLLRNYHKMGCKISLRIHLLHSHLPFFHENLGAVLDEHGERFQQDIAVIEEVQRKVVNWNARRILLVTEKR